jgi:DNA-binding CsgD family transcriptional regulator
VVSLLLQGQGIVEIARALSISTSAASTLKGRAFTKLNVQSVVELSRLAYYQGLHPDGGAILS